MDPLATVEELEAHLQRVVDVDQGEQALTLASGAVRAYCGWDLHQQESTLYADSDGGQLLTLPTLHLLSIDAVRCNGVALTADELAALTWSRKGQIFARTGWSPYAHFEVDCEHGYDPIPDLIKLCVLDVASKQISNPQGLISAVVGSVQRTWTTSAMPDPLMSALHERLLDRYRL